MIGKKQKRNSTNRPEGGMLSLSHKEFIILEMLAQSGQELFGLAMIEASGGGLKRGTVYVTLQRMQEKGLVDSRPEPRVAPEIGIPRRLYSITGYGARIYQAFQFAHALMASDSIVVGG